jgi:hypothetical protein
MAKELNFAMLRKWADVWKYAEKKDVKDIKKIMSDVSDALSLKGKSKKHKELGAGLMLYMEFMMAVSYQVNRSGLRGDDAKSAFISLYNDPALINENFDDLFLPVDAHLIGMAEKIMAVSK